MAQAFVQAVSAQVLSSASSCTTAAITTTTGNLLVLTGFESSSSNFAATPLSDSKSNSWTSASFAPFGSTNKQVQRYNASITGGTLHTFTCSTSGNHFPAVAAVELDGMSATPFDKSGVTADQSGSDPHTSAATTTTAQANEIVICASNNSAGTSSYVDNVGTLCTAQNNTAGTPLGVGYRLVTATGTYSASFNFSGGSSVGSQSTSTWKEDTVTGLPPGLGPGDMLDTVAMTANQSAMMR